MLMRVFPLFILLIGLAISWSLEQARQAAAITTSPIVELHQLPALKIGDWVFRQGTSVESELIANIGQSRFSHIGVVTAIEPEVIITHATTNDDPNYSNQVINSRLIDFSSNQLARRIAIARPQFLSTEQQQRISQHIAAKISQPFVLSQRQHPHLYCTTLIADAITEQQPDFSLPWLSIDQPVFRGEYLHPQAFAERTDIEWLYPPTNSSTE